MAIVIADSKTDNSKTIQDEIDNNVDKNEITFFVKGEGYIFISKTIILPNTITIDFKRI